MSAPPRTGLRATRRALWYALAVVLVMMALGAVAASRLLPMLERNPERVEAWLGERVGHPVAFDSLDTDWTRRGPLLRLDGLRIGRGEDAITIGEAEVLVAQYAGLLPGRSLTELRLRNLDLTLERDDDGRWHARGLPGQDGGGDPFSALERLGELQVIGGSLTIDAPALGLHAAIPRIDVRLRVNGDRVRAAARAWMEQEDAPLLAAARFDRDSGDGELYAGLDGVGLDAWAPLLRVAGVAIDDGRGQAQAWVEVRDSRIESLAARLDLQGVDLRGAGAGGAAPGRVGFDYLQGDFEWTSVEDGWRLDVPRLQAASGEEAWRTEHLAMRIGSHYALVADRIEAAPLLAVLALSDRVTPAVGAWLGGSGANAVLEDVELAGTRGGRMQVRARVESVAFGPVGDRPGLEGLRGELTGDAHGLVFAFDPQAPLRFDWPSGFGVVHEVLLAGEVSAWAVDDGWQVQSAALRLDGDGYGADVRGGLLFQGDGSRPRIDMAARLDEARTPVAKGFWVRYLMPGQAVQWLDMALVDGRILNGRAVVSGDLDDWPFDAASGPAAPGLFHAEAELADATLRFQPDWPAAEQLQGRLRFIANGFDFRGRGEIAGVPVEQLEAGIADFDRSELAVTTSTAADAGRVIGMLQQSPLSVDALQGLQAGGEMEGNFAMLLPLHGNGNGPRIEGAARLSGVQAAIPEWELALEELRGELAYDEHGFAGRSLNAWFEGRPGLLSLRAGEGHVAAPAHAFEGELRAGLDAADLLVRAPQLDWLRPHLDGRSRWTVGVAVPRATGDEAAGAALLSLHSDLVGTALDLPPPLRKPAAEALPARVRIPLPLGEGDVAVRLGQRLSLRARDGDGEAAVRVMLGGAAAAAPMAGLVVEGRTPELAALEWAGLVAAGTSADSDAEPGASIDVIGVDAGVGGPQAALALREIDLQVDQLLLAGGGFGSVHVGSVPEDDGTRLQFEGEALAGHLILPDAAQATLAGHFERLHWHRQKKVPAVADAPAADAPEEPGQGPDPALIQPIRLSVGDLRLDQARLGNATLASSRIDGGIRIDQFETQSPVHHVVISGDWTGRGAQARTQMEMRVASADFGSLLEGLGYHGHVSGGDGQVQMTAAWPGSPTGFSAEKVGGELGLSLRDGQLVEVEPGAGRLLGLLSIAELPRRLSLDFRDFFNRGFAFNRIEGDIQVVSGQAGSDNLVMDGPAATIHIAGQADLRARTYDQTIEVLPKSGNVLTAVGAIAGGPVGAAVGAVANAVLRKPLSELGSTTYRVTGPWQEPQVEVVRREPPQVAGDEPGLPQPEGGLP
ncbi:MAG: YhdP family protein [Luteimonas sp.]